MAGEERHTVLPYAAREEREAEGAEVSGRGEIKVRMLVPGDLQVPKEIVGVVLTPEVSFCERNGQAVEVFGWLDTQVFYEPHRREEGSLAPEGEADGLLEDVGTTDSGLGVAENVAPPDDYFLDLAKAGRDRVLEVMGQEKQLGGEQLLQFSSEPGKSPPVLCLAQRVPFNLTLSGLAGFSTESPVNPLVRNVECTIRGGRVIDYQVSLDFWPPAGEEAAQAVEAVDGLPGAAPGEGTELDIEAEAPGLETEPVLMEAGKWRVKGIDEPVEVTEASAEDRPAAEGEGQGRPAEELQLPAVGRTEAPAALVVEMPWRVEPKREIGIAYQPSSSPRRHSQRGRREQRPKIESAEEVRMPRPLARPAKDAAAEQPVQTGPAEPAGSAKSRSSQRKGRRQTTVMRYQIGSWR